MLRRGVFAVAMLALGLGLAAGCGSLMVAIERHEPFWLPHRLDWTVYQPSHRVALATLETLKAELSEVKVTEERLSQDDRFDTPDGHSPKPGAIEIPADYPAFWVEGFVSEPTIVNCRYFELEGKTKDGKRVDVVVRLEVIGKTEQHTVVSVQVGRKGDQAFSQDLIGKISDRVQQRAVKPGSPEERTALNAAFGPQLGDDRDLEPTTGEIRLRRP